jgi:transposase-like protein
MAAIAAELGVSVVPSTIVRWGTALGSLQEIGGQVVAGRQDMCEGGRKWMYLYGAVDERGKTVESYLSRTRDTKAAKAFFRKALKHHGQPRTITLDGFEPSHSALRIMGMRNEFNFRWDNLVKIRCCPYLNNIVEQDHRRIKFRL